MRTLVIPRWFYPNNLGDSLHTFFLPQVLKMVYPNDELQVITHGELVRLMSNNPYVDMVREPQEGETKDYNFWRDFAFTQKADAQIHCVFAEWHPLLWTYWNDNFDYLTNHPTANLLTVNSLLQLGLERLLFDGTELHTSLLPELPEIPREPNTVCIVPATKLAGRPNPHPGCDGRGFRFNGDEGQSWTAFIKALKEENPGVKVASVGGPRIDGVDEAFGNMDWGNLAMLCSTFALGVMSDGGLHHMFNLVETPVVLLGAQKINKPEFFMTANATVFSELTEECNKLCGETIKNLTGWPDLGKTCNGSCESVDPVVLAKKVNQLL